MARNAREFRTTNAALIAAEGHYPVDILLQQNGRKDTASTYVANDADFRIRLAERQYDPGLDKLFVWLPEPAGSDMLDVS